MSRTTGPRLLGIMLGFVGAALDFFSGYVLLQASVNFVNGGMGLATQGTTGTVWGIGVVALGLVLLATTIAALIPSGIPKMGDFGSLMIVYGIAMLFIGAFMVSGFSSPMGNSVLSGLGMLSVGILMLVNGTLMWRSPITATGDSHG